MEAISVEGDEGACGQAVLAEEAKDAVFHELSDAGYFVCRTGWPDFICALDKDGVEGIVAIAVKPGGASLTGAEKAVAWLLRKGGIEYAIYRPDRAEWEQIEILAPHPDGPVCPQ